ncbi:MAG: hypothetical protein AAGA93_06065 [Actinomycetota bacterium]
MISLLACSLVGVDIEIDITPGSLLDRLHRRHGAATDGGSPSGRRERTTCNYGLDPAMQTIADEHGMRISAIDDTGEVRAIERTDHPFFVATLYQPQLSSEPGAPHPVLVGFVEAAADRARARG